MNEELQTALADILNTGLQAKDFILAELPDVVYQLLLWHGTYNFVLFLCGIGLAYAIYKVNRLQYQWIKNENLFDDPFITCNLVQILWVLPLGHLLNLEWLQIWIAPKVWLIEYAASLTK